MKHVCLVTLLLVFALHGGARTSATDEKNSEILSAADNARIALAGFHTGDRGQRRLALFRLHSLGKEAIPLLIQGLDDKKPFSAIELVNPMWSNLPPEVLGRTFSGVANAYAIELILGKDKLEGDQEDARFLIDPRECVHVYGLLKRNDSVLKSQDLVSLERRYQVWWNDHKQLPLVELRKQWADNNRPLTGSDFRWL